MIQYRRQWELICGNLAEENYDQLSKRISLQSGDLIKESGKTLLTPGTLGEERNSLHRLDLSFYPQTSLF